MLRQTGLACSKSRLAQGVFIPQAVVDANTVLRIANNHCIYEWFLS